MIVMDRWTWPLLVVIDAHLRCMYLCFVRELGLGIVGSRAAMHALHPSSQVSPPSMPLSTTHYECQCFVRIAGMHAYVHDYSIYSNSDA